MLYNLLFSSWVNTLRDPGTCRINKHDYAPVLEIWDSTQYIQYLFPGKNKRQCLGRFRGWKVFTGPLFMVNLGKKKFKGVVSHFNTTGFMLAIGKHILKISAKFLNSGLLGVAFKEILIIGDVPPITLIGTRT